MWIRSLFLAWLVLLCLSPAAQARMPATAAAQISQIAVADLPPEAIRILAKIQRGEPFAHHKDGSEFFNRERKLPVREPGYYTEYTVPTPGSRDRGARRIIAGGRPGVSGEYYYTRDHYRNFRRIREAAR